MVDEKATYQQFGIRPPFKVRDKLIVVCENCKQSRSICGRVYKKIIKQDNLTLCSSCRAKHNREKYLDSYVKSNLERAKALSRTYKEKWKDKKYRTKQLIAITSMSSRQKHSVATRKLWQNPLYRETVLANKARIEGSRSHKQKMRAIYNSDEYRRMLRERWQDEVYRGKVLEIWSNGVFREQFVRECRERSLDKWQDPKYRERMKQAARVNSELLKRLYSDSVMREIISEAVRLVWQRDGHRERQREISINLWKDEGYRSKVMAILGSDDVRDKLSKASRERWTCPEYREKMAVALINMPRISKGQRRVYSLLSELGVEYYEEGLKTKFGPHVFDCLVPRQDVMTKHLLIEHHGEFFHGQNKRIRQDRSKLSYIKNNFPDYEVRVVWEQWWLFRGKVESMVREWLGWGNALPQVDFNFREVVLGFCSYKQALVFLSEHHYLYTCPRGSRYFGAYYGDKLIAVCLLSPLIRQNIAKSIRNDLVHSDVLELSRFCIHPSYQKKNFASWFIARCLSKINVRVVVAYSDLTLGHEGVIYKASGFVLDKRVRPDYWYVNKENWVMHKRTLYGRACKMSMKEVEYASLHGYRKVYGGEKLRFVKFLN